MDRIPGQDTIDLRCPTCGRTHTMDVNDLGYWLSNEEFEALDDTMTFPCEGCLGPAECLRRGYLMMMQAYRQQRAVNRNDMTPGQQSDHMASLHKMSRRLVKVRRWLRDAGVDVPSLKEHVGY